MARGIFISYRRDDSRHAAGRLADDLAQTFGERTIFRDIEGIDPGVDFTKALEHALQECVVMLVLIGPAWLDQRDAQGRRRLDQADDWIRQEVASALGRDIRVMPVLLEGAKRPEASELPPELAVLAARQTLEMSDARWRGDLQRLVEVLGRVPELAPLTPPSGTGQAPPQASSAPASPAPRSGGSRFRTLLTGAGLGVVGLVALSLWWEEAGLDDAAVPGVTGDATMPVTPPAVTPEPRPRQPPAAATVGDISGLWRTLTGEVYHFEQQGQAVEFVAEAAGQPMGHGRGRFDGQTLQLAFTMQVQGVVMGQAQCELRASPGLQGFAGMCQGPNGPFAAQMFR